MNAETYHALLLANRHAEAFDLVRRLTPDERLYMAVALCAMNCRCHRWIDAYSWWMSFWDQQLNVRAMPSRLDGDAREMLPRTIPQASRKTAPSASVQMEMSL